MGYEGAGRSYCVVSAGIGRFDPGVPRQDPLGSRVDGGQGFESPIEAQASISSAWQSAVAKIKWASRSTGGFLPCKQEIRVRFPGGPPSQRYGGRGLSTINDIPPLKT